MPIFIGPTASSRGGGRGVGGGLPFKSDGSDRRTFQGYKFVVWCQFSIKNDRYQNYSDTFKGIKPEKCADRNNFSESIGFS